MVVHKRNVEISRITHETCSLLHWCRQTDILVYDEMKMKLRYELHMEFQLER